MQPHRSPSPEPLHPSASSAATLLPVAGRGACSGQRLLPPGTKHLRTLAEPASLGELVPAVACPAAISPRSLLRGSGELLPEWAAPLLGRGPIPGLEDGTAAPHSPSSHVPGCPWLKLGGHGFFFLREETQTGLLDLGICSLSGSGTIFHLSPCNTTITHSSTTGKKKQSLRLWGSAPFIKKKKYKNSQGKEGGRRVGEAERECPGWPLRSWTRGLPQNAQGSQAHMRRVGLPG